MSDELGEPIPEDPGEDPGTSPDEPRTDGIGLSDSPHSGYDLGAEDPATPSRTEDAADRGEVPDAREGRDGT